MRIWLKYVIGIVLGLIFALVLPQQQNHDILDFIVDFVIHCGRYTLVPLLFFSIATACYKLREEKLMLKTGLWSFGVIVTSTLFLVVIGLLVALQVKLPRIPMAIEIVNESPVIDVKGLLLQLFPYSGFKALLSDAYLLPCFIFAGLVGAGANDDRDAAKPAMTVFNSLSRVCYVVMGFFTEILAAGMIAISCKWFIDFFAIRKAVVYNPLFVLLTALFLFTALIVYPLAIFFICKDKRPFRVIYASIAPVIASFFSGDTNMTLPLAIRHGKESLGIQRRVNGVAYPLFSIFARGGAALVTCVCFVVILRSYSLLEIKLSTVLWIGFFSFIFSFVLCEHSSGGAFLLLTMLCVKYGGGYEAGYLLLKDCAPVLCSFAAAFDALTTMVGSYIVGSQTDCIRHQELRKFI